MAEFDGKVALVTGGGRGIGQAVGELLLARGAKVASFDLVSRAPPIGCHPPEPASKPALGSRFLGSSPGAWATVLSGAAPVVEVPASPGWDAAADRSAGFWSGPDDVPTQAAAVRTSSTARPTPVQSCHRRRRGSGSARWRGGRFMSAPEFGCSGRGMQLRKLDDFIRSLPLVTPAARW